MTLASTGNGRNRAARVAGFAYLFGIGLVIAANYGIGFRLIVPGNAVDTASNILAHSTLFRLNIALDLVYAFTIVSLLAALYVVLEPASRTLALIAAFSRLVYALLWAMIALGMAGALRFLGDAAYLSAFGTEQLHALARLDLVTGHDAYHVGLPFWGVASALCASLFFTSRSIPRALAAYGIVASAWCVVCGLAFIVHPGFENTVGASWFDLPMTAFELIAGVWLLVKGVSPPEPARSG